MTGDDHARPALSVAYLVNQYPKVSHTFIRREILALERRGVAVARYAIRGWDAETPDPADAAEQRRTRYVLGDGALALLAPLLRTAVGSPKRFVAGLRLAIRLGRRADRPLAVHLVYLAEACRLLEWLRDAKVAHLHAHFGTNAAEVALLCRTLGGPPYSFTVHGPEEFDKPEALRLADKAAHAAFVVAISSYGRAQLCRWLKPEDATRVEVVRCGIESDAFAAARSHDGDAAGRGATPPVGIDPAAAVRFVCVGRLCAQKGQLLLLNATATLVRRGVDVRLVLAGDGEMRSEVEAAIASLALGDRVRITGWISSADVERELDAARALVLPSFAEGLPVVVMEAMARRRPVISTFVAGIPELVVDGETGWLVPAGDATALADAMQACAVADAERLRAFGDAGFARVRERHDVDREAGTLAALFDAA